MRSRYSLSEIIQILSESSWTTPRLGSSRRACRQRPCGGGRIKASDIGQYSSKVSPRRPPACRRRPHSRWHCRLRGRDMIPSCAACDKFLPSTHSAEESVALVPERGEFRLLVGDPVGVPCFIRGSGIGRSLLGQLAEIVFGHLYASLDFGKGC